MTAPDADAESDTDTVTLAVFFTVPVTVTSDCHETGARYSSNSDGDMVTFTVNVAMAFLLRHPLLQWYNFH